MTYKKNTKKITLQLPISNRRNSQTKKPYFLARQASKIENLNLISPLWERIKKWSTCAKEMPGNEVFDNSWKLFENHLKSQKFSPVLMKIIQQNEILTVVDWRIGFQHLITRSWFSEILFKSWHSREELVVEKNIIVTGRDEKIVERDGQILLHFPIYE